jgi:predicted metal-dependent hydrolase
VDADGAASLREAARLFDRGEYHAAHELLDELWEATHGEDADFLKGLIQACIAMHHYRDGNLEGARKLYRGHRQYLGAYLPAHAGVDVAGFLGEMQRTLGAALRAGGAEPPAETDAPRMVFVE